MTTQIKPSKYTSQDGTRVAKVVFDEEWEEFQVKLWVDKKFQKNATYHTDDLDDAIGTARMMIK